jgi:tetratricopeptide (TPR) repeat protein
MRNLPVRAKGLLFFLAIVVTATGIYYLPPVHNRLAWRVDEAWNSIRLFFRPPDDAVFIPIQLSSDNPTQTPPVATETSLPSMLATATIAPTPLPGAIRLPGVIYVDQHNRWNYCGPANLTMALNFWGWAGNRDDVAMVVRPGRNEPDIDFISRGRTDLNVMPFELVDFVNEHTEFSALWRYGGNLDLLKKLLASGFPMIIEKGYYAHDTTNTISWMGHYEFITGYDDAATTMLVQDAYEFGPDFIVSINEFNQGWRAFNYLFLIVYPPEREQELFGLLNNWTDPLWATQHALEIALQDTQSLTGNDLYFSWFNVGTSLTQIQQFAEASSAYDQAFQIYAALGDDNSQRPYRMIWYQTGPYEAYYFAGRFQDVINLADITLSTPRTGPTLEESLYWRALAEYALGYFDAAYTDMRQAVYYNPNYRPALTKLEEWGLTPQP